MNTHAQAALRARLQADPNADISTLRTDTDKRLAIGADVWRLLWRGQLACAVAQDANLPTTLGAMLDVLALLEDETPELVPSDSGQVHVLVDRPLPDRDAGSEVAQALRSLRSAVDGVDARIWYRGDNTSWVQDTGAPPEWRDNEQVRGWVHDLLLPRLTTPPTPLADALVREVDDPSLHLYPSEIGLGKPQNWALRLDGLQIGTVGDSSGMLTVGAPGKAGDGPERTVFKQIAGCYELAFALQPSADEVSLGEAVGVIQRLMKRWRSTEVRGAPVTHRYHHGIGVVDEHALEARLLKGLIWLPDHPQAQLVRNDEQVARGSQFPTLWAQTGSAKYLDAILADGTTPLAIELKVATGGQGRYYRRALYQAVLYRHFIQNAPDLDPWFRAAALERRATRAVVGIVIATPWSGPFETTLELLKRVARLVGVEVAVLDDRETPDWAVEAAGSVPTRQVIERLSWSLAGALVHRWPRSLGRVVELYRGVGQFDAIQLQSRNDRRLDSPSRQPRIALNRSGSAWVSSPLGTHRWVWRGIWRYLAEGGDLADAARVIGVTAGLPHETASKKPNFCELASAFLNEVTDRDAWSWRCAWASGHYERARMPGLERFHSVLTHYDHQAQPFEIPTIARIWCAVHHNQAEVAIDQQNLRVWVSTPDGVQEAPQVDAHERVLFVSRLVGANHNQVDEDFGR